MRNKYGTTDYACECHVCGKIHTVKADFMTGNSLIKGKDGIERIQYACNAGHTAEEIRAAYLANGGVLRDGSK